MDQSFGGGHFPMPPSRFDIVGHKDPQTLIRLLNYFAALGLAPSQVTAVAADGMMAIAIEQPDLGEKQARIIAEKMRSSVLVESVRLRLGQHLLTPLIETMHELPAQ